MLVDYEDKRKAKVRSDDRILVLKIIDKKAPLATSGVIDRRLFNGEDNLHAVMNSMDCLWTFKYNTGMLPEPLKQKFTSFSALKRFADGYFNKRNMMITEVKNA